MSQYIRRDDWVISGTGQAQPGVSVYYYVQPSLALATVYTSATGAEITTNPQITDGLGHAVAYLVPGLYTIQYSGQQIATLTDTDQNVGATANSIAPVVPAGAINGVGATGNRTYTLPSTPGFPLAAQYFVNGAFSTAYTISGATLTYTGVLPLQVGDTHEIFYS